MREEKFSNEIWVRVQVFLYVFATQKSHTFASNTQPAEGYPYRTPHFECSEFAPLQQSLGRRPQNAFRLV